MASSGEEAPNQHRRRLVRFYEKYNQSCLPSVDAILSTYQGREDELLRVLTNKYGPEPVSADTDDADGAAMGGAQAHHHQHRGVSPGHVTGGADVVAVRDSPGRQRSPFLPPHLRSHQSSAQPSRGPSPGGSQQQQQLSSSSVGRNDVADPAAREAQDRVVRLLVRYKVDGRSSVQPSRIRSMSEADALRAVDRLVAAHGPEPPATPDGSVDWRAVIGGFLDERCPAERSKLDALLENFAGREREVLSALSRRYPAGSATGVATTPEASRSAIEAAIAGHPQRAGGSGATAVVNASLTPEERASLRQRLNAFYTVHNPEKLGAVDQILGAFRGRPEDLISQLVAKYGPEPPQSTHQHQQHQSRSAGGATAEQAPQGAPSSRPQHLVVSSSHQHLDDAASFVSDTASMAASLTAPPPAAPAAAAAEGTAVPATQSSSPSAPQQHQQPTSSAAVPTSAPTAQLQPQPPSMPATHDRAMPSVTFAPAPAGAPGAAAASKTEEASSRPLPLADDNHPSPAAQRAALGAGEQQAQPASPSASTRQHHHQPPPPQPQQESAAPEAAKAQQQQQPPPSPSAARARDAAAASLQHRPPTEQSSDQPTAAAARGSQSSASVPRKANVPRSDLDWPSRFYNLYSYYRPDKLLQLGEKLKTHRGREAQWMSLLMLKYGQEPPPRTGYAAPDMDGVEFQRELRWLFQRNDPAMLEVVDNICDDPTIARAEFLRDARARYGLYSAERRTRSPDFAAHTGVHGTSAAGRSANSSSAAINASRPLHQSQPSASRNPPDDSGLGFRSPSPHGSTQGAAAQLPRSNSQTKPAPSATHSRVPSTVGGGGGRSNELEEAVSQLSNALEEKTAELETMARRVEEARGDREMLERKVDEADGTQRALEGENVRLKRLVKEKDASIQRLEDEVAGIPKMHTELEATKQHAAQSSSTVAVREHQNRVLRMQMQQLGEELALKDQKIKVGLQQVQTLQDSLAERLSDVAALQLDLTPSSDPEKFYAVVDDIKDAFRTHYDERIAADEAEMREYHSYAEAQIANREAIIDELLDVLAKTLKPTPAAPPPPPQQQRRHHELSSLPHERTGGEDGGVEADRDDSPNTAEELARLRTQLAVQQEEHKALVQAMTLRQHTASLQAPQLSVLNKSSSSSAAGPNVSVADPTRASVLEESRAIREVKQRMQAQEAEAQASQAALAAELQRHMSDLQRMHERMLQLDTERGEERQRAEELEDELMTYRTGRHPSQSIGQYGAAASQHQPQQQRQQNQVAEEEERGGGHQDYRAANALAESKRLLDQAASVSRRYAIPSDTSPTTGAPPPPPQDEPNAPSPLQGAPPASAPEPIKRDALAASTAANAAGVVRTANTNNAAVSGGGGGGGGDSRASGGSTWKAPRNGTVWGMVYGGDGNAGQGQDQGAPPEQSPAPTRPPGADYFAAHLAAAGRPL